jgi:hypothetical protein
MADNGYTETFQDGTSLTQAELETAFKSLKLDIANTTQLTSGSTSGYFLKSNGDAAAASFAAVPDPLGPFALRNYGLAATASAGALTVSLKSNAGSDASSIDKVNLTFSNNGSTTGTYTAVDVTAALSLTITASASLGFSSTATNRVFVYALNNSGTPRLGVSARSDLDQGSTTTTVAMSASADGATVMYATAALTVVPRLLGWVEAAHNSTGSWQTPSKTNVTNNAGVSNTVTANQIVYQSTTRTIATPATSGNVLRTTSCNAFSTTNTVETSVTNLSGDLTVIGRPVWVGLVPDGSVGNLSSITVEKLTADNISQATAQIFIKRGATIIASQRISTQMFQNTTGSFLVEVPVSSISTIDNTGAGTATYSVTVLVGNSSSTIEINYAKLLAYEL